MNGKNELKMIWAEVHHRGLFPCYKRISSLESQLFSGTRSKLQHFEMFIFFLWETMPTLTSSEILPPKFACVQKL
jgi:hypothetical protein